MNILELKEQAYVKTLNFIGLTLITGGIYVILWFAKNNEDIENLFNAEKSNKNYTIYLAVCLGLGTVLNSFMVLELMLIAQILPIIYSILLIIWALKIKKAMLSYAINEYKVNYSMNTFYTVIFNLYYINYCIDDLNNIVEKEKRIKE
jgi:hypothetical protein